MHRSAFRICCHLSKYFGEVNSLEYEKAQQETVVRVAAEFGEKKYGDVPKSSYIHTESDYDPNAPRFAMYYTPTITPTRQYTSHTSEWQRHGFYTHRRVKLPDGTFGRRLVYIEAHVCRRNKGKNESGS